MSLQSTFTKRVLRAAFISLALLFSAPAVAQNMIEKLVSPGDLSKAHEESDATCKSCHTNFDKTAQNTLCIACHKDVSADIQSGKGFHGKSPDLDGAPCKSCHTEHEGVSFDIAKFDQATFDHSLTDYPLAGGHLKVECGACHESTKKFSEAPSRCNDCHSDDDPHKGTLGPDCQSCHAVSNWKQVKFDHSKTKFPLFGKHNSVECVACHADQKFKGVATDCVSCHRGDDAHKGAFGPDCASCHDASSWTKTSFDHGVKTRFALTGKHATAVCSACHTGSLTDPKLQVTCVSCHRKDDSHKGRNGPDCASCHDAFSWITTRFDHNKRTKFPLRGAHAKVICAACHIEPVNKRLPGLACVDCHGADDPHKGSQGEKCAACHNEVSWTASVRFDHDLSGFPLLGRHKTAACADCHKSKDFKEASRDCAVCHCDDDVHTGALSRDCAQCHNPNSWSLWIFDHNAQTDFSLTGAHEGLKCAACHNSPVGAKINQPSECIACHRADDKHRGRYGSSCERCHTTKSFNEIRLP